MIFGRTILLLSLCCIAAAQTGEWETALSPFYDFEADPSCNWTQFRLPTNVKPTVYHLNIEADIAPPFAVAGSVDIEVDVDTLTRCVVMHADGINITYVSFTALEGPSSKGPSEESAKSLQNAVEGNYSMNEESQQLTLEFPESLPQAGAVLHLNFTYSLYEAIQGLYLSNTTDDAGNENLIALTQFEPTSAREAFPCFDEPNFKARWAISLNIPSDLIALSNMNEIGNTTDAASGMTRHQFATSPPYSSYLVAWVIGNLSSVEGSVPSPYADQPDRPVRVFASPDYAGSLNYSLSVATKMLPLYERIYEEPYPLPKLDFVSIPYFSAQGMENFGLIIIEASGILINPQEPSVSDQLTVTILVVHEMCHQWFGNLVTEVWWNNLWLAEAFATYWEMTATEIVRPEFQALQNFWFTQTEVTGLQADDSGGFHALSAPPESLDSLGAPAAYFDGVEYQFGGSLLRMLRAYLHQNSGQAQQNSSTITNTGGSRKPLQAHGASTGVNTDPFLKGQSLYLQSHKFANAIGADLLDNFGDATGNPVSAWLYNWVYVSGLPLLNVTVSGNGGIYVSQTRIQVGEQNTTCDDNILGEGGPWWVPLAFVTRGQPLNATWAAFHTCTTGPIYTLKDDSDWIKLNGLQYGLYRVQYPEDLWYRLTQAARAGPANLSTIDFSGLLDDSYTFATGGSEPINTFLELSRALATRTQQPEYGPWNEVYTNGFLNLDLLLPQYNASCAADWRSFIANNITGPFIANFGRGNSTVRAIDDFRVTEATRPTISLASNGLREPAALSMLRPIVLSMAASYGHDRDVLSRASENLGLASRAPVPGEDRIDPDLIPTTFKLALLDGNDTALDIVLENVQQPRSFAVREAAIDALATAGPGLINQTLNLTLTPTVPYPDVTTFLQTAGQAGGATLEAAWAFLQTNIAELAARLGDETPENIDYDLGPVISSVAGQFSSQQAIDQVNALQQSLASQGLITDPSPFDDAIAATQANMLFLELNAADACAWLANY
ncbi:hypothetical protein WJX73_004649 [Symbiochloris irregularis]|uniref:Alpha-aminoacylpeptide hydrolase n=1 Tax=Symbiochloris irregularis TaxID=706552 RepID=A0AAW1PXD9_9CHLO